jgi:hypothetical protein
LPDSGVHALAWAPLAWRTQKYWGELVELTV